MKNPNPFLKPFLLLFIPLIFMLLCMHQAVGTELETNLNNRPTHPEHQFTLATLYHYGQNKNIKKDPLLAIYWYEQAAQQGHREAQFRVGYLLCEEYSAINEFQRGFRWLQQAATQGEMRAQYTIGCIYLEGKNMPKDLQQARHWLEMAMQAGHPEAQRMLLFCQG